jgi:threonine dehydrogenase-like Zn-dependent dehydrogenase
LIEEIKSTIPTPQIAIIREQITNITAKGVDVVIDRVGAENTISDTFRILNKGGTFVVVGMFGTEVKIPLVPAILNEYQSIFHSGEFITIFVRL